MPEAEAHGERSLRPLRGLLQRAIPPAEIDVHLAHLDAVLTRVAHELGRLIKTHRLAVEDGGAKNLRIVALHPGGSIDEQREACRVAFGKTVFAKTLDLAEAALGKFARVAATGHAGDEFVAEEMDSSIMPEGRHGAPQSVGFIGREFGGGDGDLHRLFLEQRHAERSFQDLFQFVDGAMRQIGRWVVGLLDSIAPTQIRMHHVALDRTRTHDRDLDDEVIEFLRLQTRQHRHLCAAFDLEHADRIGA